jgi:hypothetical protein
MITAPLARWSVTSGLTLAVGLVGWGCMIGAAAPPSEPREVRTTASTTYPVVLAGGGAVRVGSRIASAGGGSSGWVGGRSGSVYWEHTRVNPYGCGDDLLAMCLIR